MKFLFTFNSQDICNDRQEFVTAEGFASLNQAVEWSHNKACEISARLGKAMYAAGCVQQDVVKPSFSMNAVPSYWAEDVVEL